MNTLIWKWRRAQRTVVRRVADEQANIPVLDTENGGFVIPKRGHDKKIDEKAAAYDYKDKTNKPPVTDPETKKKG